ncbi:MAG: hypothetical protein HQK60_01990 [Deltaproteobacteria bacterium]|nr:hypothetical protein [Deltaproteobacteria bacterium]
MTEAVKLEIDGPVALLTLRVPPINALDDSALHEPPEEHRADVSVEQRKTTRTGRGDPVFFVA